MAGDNALEAPSINPLHTLRKAHAVSTANAIPDGALLPHALRIGEHTEDLGQNAARRGLARLAVLLGGGVVEEEIGLDEGTRGLVVEDDFLVLMRGHIFDIEFGVKLGGDGWIWLACVEEVCEGDFFVVLAVTLGGEAFWGEDGGVGEGCVPGAQEDVMLWGLVWA